MDKNTLPGVLADQSKAALRSSQSAASIVEHLSPVQDRAGGISGILKKAPGK